MRSTKFDNGQWKLFLDFFGKKWTDKIPLPFDRRKADGRKTTPPRTNRHHSQLQPYIHLDHLNVWFLKRRHTQSRFAHGQTHSLSSERGIAIRSATTDRPESVRAPLDTLLIEMNQPAQEKRKTDNQL